MLAAAMLAGVVCGVWWCLSREETRASPPQKTSIPSVRTNTLPIVAAKRDLPAADQFVTNRRGQVVKKVEEKTYVDERGVLRYEGGARVYRHDKPRKAIKAMQNDPFPKLKHKSDYEIATLLTVQPGGMLFGEVRYDEDFKKAFVESLLDRNEPENGDSDWDRDLKAAVEETKRELAERIKAGEDLSAILKEAREEARRLASYKREVEGLVSEAMRNENFSEADLRDVVKAANTMLESKGIEPLKEDAFLRGRFRVLSAERRRLELLHTTKSRAD